MAFWEPWHGCHRFSEGCRFCYIFQGDKKRGIDTNQWQKTPHFDAPIQKDKKGQYKIKSGQTVYLCFSSDFLIEEADSYRPECWQMIKERQDLHFLFLSKRIERLASCLPADWGEGYDNITIGCTVEDQKSADIRLPVFLNLPIKHRNIVVQPMIGPVNLSSYLDGVELVVAGGEYHPNARPLNLDWILDLRKQCQDAKTHFQFRQAGTHYIKDGLLQTLAYRQLSRAAKAENLDI